MRRTAIFIFCILSGMFVCRASDGREADTGLFLRAVTNYSLGRYDEARDILVLLHEDASDDAAVSYYLGLCELATGQADSAEVHIMEAVRKDSLNEWYLQALGTLYNMNGDRSGFAAVCEKLLELSPSTYNNPYTLTVIGDEKFNWRMLDAALEYYDRALELDPYYAPAELGRMEVLRRQGNFPPFFVALDRFLRNDTLREDVKCDYLGAIVDNMDSRFYWVWGWQIKKLVDLCVQVAPSEPGAYVLKLKMSIIDGQADSVIFWSRVLSGISREAGDTQNLLLALSVAGDMSYQIGDRRGAYRYYEEALEVDPDCTAVLNNYAYYLSEERRSLRKALKMSRRTIELEPDNPTYLDTCGWILYLLGRANEAKPMFKHAMIYGGKDSPVILEHYSKVLKKLGEDDLASYYSSLAEQKKGQGQ